MTNLTAVRRGNGLTEGALSEATGISLRLLRRYERGMRPGRSNLRTLAMALDVPEELLYGPDPLEAIF